MRLGLCKVRQRTGLWETGVPGPQRGGETSFEATQKTERVRPMGTMGSSQIQPVVFHRGSARESGGGSRAGRMVHHRFVTVALDKLHLPFGCVTPSPNSHSNGHTKGSDRHACNSGSALPLLGAYCPGQASRKTCDREANGLLQSLCTRFTPHPPTPCKVGGFMVPKALESQGSRGQSHRAPLWSISKLML